MYLLSTSMRDTESLRVASHPVSGNIGGTRTPATLAAPSSRPFPHARQQQQQQYSKVGLWCPCPGERGGRE